MAFKKSGGSKLTYQRRSYEQTRKRAEQSGGLREQYLSDHCSLWKPAEGENCIRILPPQWEDPQHYGIDLYVHYGIGPDNSAFLDLSRMKGEPDPISEEYDRAMAEGDVDYAKSLRSVKRVLVYIVDRDKPKDGPQMWAMPWTVDKDISSQSMDSRSREVLYIDDPDEGYDVFITRDGAGERTKYSVKIARNPSAIDLSDSDIQTITEHPLPECLVFYDYDHIKQVFSGKKTPSPVKEEKPAKKVTKPKKEPELPTWEEVHESEDLADYIDQFGLDLDPNDFDEEGELADAICEALEIKKPRKEPAKKPVKPAPKPEPEEEEEEAEDESEEEEEPEPEPEPKKSSIRDRLSKLRDRK